MIIKHYFLNEVERETYEKRVLELDDALHEVAILELDDRELLELYESKQYAYSVWENKNTSQGQTFFALVFG